jgi:hypothetical protein
MRIRPPRSAIIVLAILLFEICNMQAASSSPFLYFQVDGSVTNPTCLRLAQATLTANGFINVSVTPVSVAPGLFNAPTLFVSFASGLSKDSTQHAAIYCVATTSGTNAIIVVSADGTTSPGAAQTVLQKLRVGMGG